MPIETVGRIIAERVFENQKADGTIEILRIGLEEPARYVRDDIESLWHCVLVSEESGERKRMTLSGEDSFSAVAYAFAAAISIVNYWLNTGRPKMTYSGITGVLSDIPLAVCEPKILDEEIPDDREADAPVA